MNICKSALIPTLAALGFASPLLADQAPKADAWGVVVPGYITEASLTTKLGSDSNVYLTEGAPLSNQVSLVKRESTIVFASPRLLLNGVRLFDLPKESTVQTLSFGYVGEYNFYTRFGHESSLRHSLPVSLKIKSDAWTFALDNTFLYVDGSKTSPLYNTYSAFGTATARERRNQIQNRFATSLRYDVCNEAFVRVAANSLAYDLLTYTHNTAVEPSLKGYQNWIDRSEMSTGLDFGYKVTKDLALIAGWRVGQQLQHRYVWGGLHCQNTLNRVVLGFEGKITPWLSGSLVAGPDFRRYSDAANRGIAVRSSTTLYLDGSVTATPTADDKFTVTSKVWQWVSSTGTAAYLDSSYAVAWKHSFDKKLSLSVGTKFAAARYNLPTVRNDQLWSFPVGVAYAFSKELSVSADYQYATTHNRLPWLTGRDFDQNLFSVSAKLAF